MSMPTGVQAFLDRNDSQYAKAREHVLAALEGDQGLPENRLFTWAVARNINPWELFSNADMASGMGSMEGASGVLHTLAHAFHDDGEISFIRTKGHGPMIVMLDHREPGFREAYMAEVRAQGHAENVLHIYELDCVLAGVEEFIADYEAHAAEMQRLYDSFDLD